MLESEVGPTLDGAVVSTSHSSHFDVGMSLLNLGTLRRQMADAEGGNGKVHRCINILMEKPMTTEVGEARRLWEISAQRYPEGAFVINHTASYRPQCKVARHIIASNQIGKIRHISAKMNGVRFAVYWQFARLSLPCTFLYSNFFICRSSDPATDVVVRRSGQHWLGVQDSLEDRLLIWKSGRRTITYAW